VSAEAQRRLLAGLGLAAVALAIALAVVLLRGGGGSDEPISERAAELVPADALVFVRLSTDGEREAVDAARELAEGFPSWQRARDAVLERLVVASEDDGEIDAQGEIEGWLGDEMALALLNSPTGTAESLVLLEVADEEEARAFVARGARRSGPAQRHRGVRIDRFGAVQAAVADGFLVLGQPAAVRRAVDLTMGTGDPLSAAPTFSRLQERLPDDRAADAYATADGLRRLLVPAGGAFSLAGVLLDRPDLEGTALSVSAQEPGARVFVESLVPGRTGEAFEPELLDAVPEGTLAYLGSKGLDDTATRLVATAGTEALGDLLGQAREALGTEGAAAVQDDLLALLREETALVVLPGVPAPTMLVIARTGDEAGTQSALDRLTGSLPDLLEGAEVTTEGDVTIVTSGETQLFAAVFDGKLVLSTSAQGIEAARAPDGGIAGEESFDEVVPDRDEPVTSVVFLDFSQLLKLGEQTGLDDSRAYLAVKPDLERVRSVGASSTGTGEDTTTEIRISIP
jgi:hypothetical protein